MRDLLKILAFIGAGVIPQFVLAAVLQGVVVGVSDGDTIKLLDSDRHLYTIRLMGIDAPEKEQPYGSKAKQSKAKQSLSDLVFNQRIEVEWSKKDRYGRVVGKVLKPDGTDVCLSQINNGMAWHYKHYAAEQIPADRALYAQAETKAKTFGTGLWRDHAPVPPWEWRRRRDKQ